MFRFDPVEYLDVFHRTQIIRQIVSHHAATCIRWSHIKALALAKREGRIQIKEGIEMTYHPTITSFGLTL